MSLPADKPVIESTIEVAERQRRWLRRSVWAGIAFVVAAVLFAIGYPLFVRSQLRQHGWLLGATVGKSGIPDWAPFSVEDWFGQINYAGIEKQPLQLRDLDLLPRFPKIAAIHLEQTEVSEPALAAISKLSEIQIAKFHSTKLDGAGLRHLAKLPKLWSIDIHKTTFDEPAIENLAKCRQLRVLEFCRVTVPDECLWHFGQLALLERLSLDPSGATDRDLEQIANCGNLWALDLSETHISDAGVSSLSRLSRLRTLVLKNCAVTDDGARQIADGCPTLRYLEFEHAPMTDAAVAEFARLPALEHLVLGHIPVTDSGIESLVGCSTLKSVSLRSTKVTAAGAAELRTKLPTLDVSIE